MDYIYINGELYHHGIQGQKWGVRRYQNEDGSLTSVGRERYGYLNKRLKRSERQEAFYTFARKKNRARLASKYDLKISKADKNNNESKKKALVEKKEYKLNDFDKGTKALHAGYQKYNTIIDQYKSAKLSAFEDKAYKKSPEYKKAVKNYTNQLISDLSYGMNYTTLVYMSEYARAHQFDN